MADWYVDSSATGTGSGDTPANAGIDLASLSFASSVFWGDRIWVRRTNIIRTDSAGLRTYGRSGFNSNSHGFIAIIGWPNSGDPYYEERPAAGVSAGWDSDAGAHVAGLPYPTLVFSRNTSAGWQMRQGHIWTNFLFASSIALSSFPDGGTNKIGCQLGKVVLLNGRFDGGEQFWQDVVVIASYGNQQNYFPSGFGGGRFTITASSHMDCGLFARNNYVGEVINDSSSVACLIYGIGDDAVQITRHFGSVRGNAFVNCGANYSQAGGGSQYMSAFVEDWFGLGPRRIQSTGGTQDAAVVSSATAAYSSINSVGANCTAFFCMSLSWPTTTLGSKRPGHGDFGGYVQQYFGVSSGRPYRITLPFYWTGANCLDVNDNAYIHIRGTNGRWQRCTIRDGQITAGSPARWAGSSVGAGSAYLMSAVFTATVTQTIHIGAMPPMPVVTRSGFLFTPPFFEIVSL